MTKTTQQLVEGQDLMIGSDLGCEVVEAERKESEIKTMSNSPAYCPPASASLISRSFRSLAHKSETKKGVEEDKMMMSGENKRTFLPASVVGGSSASLVLHLWA